MPRMLRLSNGLVVLITGRPETVLHWTADGGQTWSPPVSLYDSREQSLQSENIWYGPSTGYGSIMEFAPDTLWVSYDRLGAYDPETLQRTNQVHVREVSFQFCSVFPTTSSSPYKANRPATMLSFKLAFTFVNVSVAFEIASTPDKSKRR